MDQFSRFSDENPMKPIILFVYVFKAKTEAGKLLKVLRSVRDGDQVQDQCKQSVRVSSIKAKVNKWNISSYDDGVFELFLCEKGKWRSSEGVKCWERIKFKCQMKWKWEKKSKACWQWQFYLFSRSFLSVCSACLLLFLHNSKIKIKLRRKLFQNNFTLINCFNIQSSLCFVHVLREKCKKIELGKSKISVKILVESEEVEQVEESTLP